MKITTSDKIIAYLALISGLTISAVAVWYSVAGLVSIFAAAVTPIIVMGVALEVSKLIATVWLKLNWQRAPMFIKTYMTAAVLVLMVITSMGIFGFLSKAHSDQSLVSGDVQSKIAVYDEKIKTAKENIDANRKALKQMDEAVDQVMGRSADEKGAEKAVAIRRGQTKERTRLLSEIAAEQKAIAQLSEARAPIAAEVRKVEAEVGPIKYIAAFVYGDNPDANVLEKAVTWVIIIIVSVFDPLAVILLLASQYSFQWFRKQDEDDNLLHKTVPLYVADVGEKPTEEEKISETDLADEANALIAEIEPEEVLVELPTEPMKFNDPGEHPNDYDETAVEEPEPVPEKSILEQHPYLNQPFSHFKDLQPMVYKSEDQAKVDFETGNIANLDWDVVEALEEEKAAQSIFPEDPVKGQRFTDVDTERNYIFNGSDWINYDQSDRDAVTALEHAAEAELKKKSYMIKDQDQQIKKTIE